MENNKQVAVVNNEKSALVAMEFNEQQVDLIKKTVAKGTTNDELALFLYTCKRTGLDPLIKQIYAVKRNTKGGPVMAIQTGIDGYRLIAERTGKYSPGKEPLFKYDKDGKLFSATAYVNKMVGGAWHEVAATAIMSEYNNATNPIWIKMPHAMLSKCAESLVLRKAFPAEMGGVYTQEEMNQADVVDVHPTTAPVNPKPAPVASPKPVEKAPQAAEDAEIVGEPTKQPETASNAISGHLTAYYPPKGKGPAAFKVSGNNDYFKTFDKDMMAMLENAHKTGETVSFQYDVIEKNGFTNLMIKNLEVKAEEAYTPSPMGDEEGPGF